MQILVTGVGGFVGSHPVGRRVARGHAVTVINTLGPEVHGAGPRYLEAHLKAGSEMLLELFVAARDRCTNFLVASSMSLYGEGGSRGAARGGARSARDDREGLLARPVDKREAALDELLIDTELRERLRRSTRVEALFSAHVDGPRRQAASV